MHRFIPGLLSHIDSCRQPRAPRRVDGAATGAGRADGLVAWEGLLDNHPHDPGEGGRSMQRPWCTARALGPGSLHRGGGAGRRTCRVPERPEPRHHQERRIEPPTARPAAAERRAGAVRLKAIVRSFRHGDGAAALPNPAFGRPQRRGPRRESGGDSSEEYHEHQQRRRHKECASASRVSHLRTSSSISVQWHILRSSDAGPHQSTRLCTQPAQIRRWSLDGRSTGHPVRFPASRASRCASICSTFGSAIVSLSSRLQAPQDSPENSRQAPCSRAAPVSGALPPGPILRPVRK